MSLTMASGPLSVRPAPSNYTIDGPKHRLFFEPHPRRIRAVFAGRTVLDTVRGHLLHESNLLPVLYVPIEDLDESVLEPTDHRTHCPYKGDASYWSVRRSEGEVLEDAVWSYQAGDLFPDGPRAIADLVAFLHDDVEVRVVGPTRLTAAVG